MFDHEMQRALEADTKKLRDLGAIPMWSFELASEDEPCGEYYILHGDKHVACANNREWAELIVAGLIRDDAAHRAASAKIPPQPEIAF